MAERLFMQWSHFQSYITQSFQDMRLGEELFDVTLVCDDGKQLDAHKVILSACSPIFRQMMQKSKHPHPLVFMVGVKSKDLEDVLDFLYNGEVSLDQDNLVGFLSVAQRLKISGLSNFQTTDIHDEQQVTSKEESHISKGIRTNLAEDIRIRSKSEDHKAKSKGETAGGKKHNCSDCGKYFNSLPILEMHLLSHTESQADVLMRETTDLIENRTELTLSKIKEEVTEIDENFEAGLLIFEENVEAQSTTFVETNKFGNEKCIKIPLIQFDGKSKSIESLNDTLKEMVEFEEFGSWKCKVCGKMSKNRSHAKEHAEVHIEGLSYPCAECGKLYASSSSLRHHKKQHK